MSDRVASQLTRSGRRLPPMSLVTVSGMLAEYAVIYADSHRL